MRCRSSDGGRSPPSHRLRRTGARLMKYSPLGATGVKVSRICLGTATFGVAPTAQDADRVVGPALDVGINFVDTADSDGHMPDFDRPRAPPAAHRHPASHLLARPPRAAVADAQDPHNSHAH